MFTNQRRDLTRGERKINRVFGYVRVSSVGQAAHGQSLEVQEENIRRYFDYRYRDGYSFEGIIQDPAVSASIPLVQRPGGMQLALKIDEGDVVVFSKLDRGFRDTIDLITTVRAWQKRGVKVEMLDLGVDLTTDVGQLILQVMGAFAEWERKRITQRIMEGKARKKANGKTVPERFLGGIPPWPWKLKNGNLVQDQEARRVSRWFIDLRQRGWTYRKMWLYCLQNRITRKRRDGKIVEWSVGMILRVIQRELELQKEEKNS